jgi:hypothetical protein
MGAIIFLGLYFLPGIIASCRGHHNAVAIWVLDLFLGWTALGWIITLVWSFTNPPQQKTIVVTQVVTPQPVYYQLPPQALPQLPAPNPQMSLPGTDWDRTAIYGAPSTDKPRRNWHAEEIAPPSDKLSVQIFKD